MELYRNEHDEQEKRIGYDWPMHQENPVVTFFVLFVLFC